MQFALLIYESPEAFAARKSDGTDSYTGAWRAYHKALVESGVFVGGDPLEVPETGTTIRIQDGKRGVQDGPYADTKEQLGGFTILELRKDGTPRKPRRSGDPNRTYFNKVNNVVIFLSAHGINRLLKKSEYPKFAEKPVVYYEAEQVKALYAAASDDEERFTLDYFLKSGVRDGEAAHAEYSDLKGGFLNIVDKPHLKWHPKHWHIRRIPIPQDLVAAIAERQRKNPNSKLIFPNGARNPDEHLLRIVQRIAKNAGGEFHADLHTFRRTYPTLCSGTTKIQTIQYLLGHKDIKTTMRYLGIADLNSPETRATVEKTFSDFKTAQIATAPVTTAAVM